MLSKNLTTSPNPPSMQRTAQKKAARETGPLFCCYESATYIIFAKSGTMRSETMLMILIIGLTAGPAVSL